MKECGSFVEREHKHTHWYAKVEPSDYVWDKVPKEFEHFLLLQWENGKFKETRQMKVLKTVVYVVVGEDVDECGNGIPRIEKWHIHSHRTWEV